MTAIVLTGMSVSEPVMERALAAVAATRDDCSVAFLQLGDPALSAELARLADEGRSRILLVGAVLSGRAPARSWLRRVAAHWLRERADPPELYVAGTVLRRLDAAELDAVVETHRDTTHGRVTGTEAELRSPGWEDVPGHRHHVLVCRGPRCSARGADRMADELDAALVEADLDDDDVLVAQTGCLFPCNHAPVVVVHPDDAWFGPVDGSVARDLVAAFASDETLPAHARLPRRRGADLEEAR